jgi:hypothetical protein
VTGDPYRASRVLVFILVLAVAGTLLILAVVLPSRT